MTQVNQEQPESTSRRRSRRKIQPLKLEPYEDVISIRDRLQFVKARRVLLIFPQGARILQRKLDLVLIQREAARRNIQIALLCQDPVIMENAAELNLSCFYTLRQARTRRWKYARSRIFVDRSHKPAGTVQHPYELMHIASRLKPGLTPSQRRMQWLGKTAITLVVILVLLGGIFAIVPSATVTLTPASDAISEPISITADAAVTEIDSRSGIIPAQVIRVVVIGNAVTVESTGRRESADLLARGRVTFTNQSDAPVFIPAGTVVSTTTNPPARFQTTFGVPLPAEVGATVEVEVVALSDTSALAGNLPADAIARVEGELETVVSVRNPNPTFGGGLGEEAVVTQADHDRLLTLGRQAVQQAARSELLLQLPTDDKFLVPDSIRLVEERPEWLVYSAQVGDAAESVTLEMRAAVEAVVVDQLQARQLAFLTLSQRLPPGRELDESSLVYRREGVGTDEQGRYVFQMFVEGNTPFTIDADAVARRINGMTVAAAKRTLENELILDPRFPPQISTFPVNLGIMPLLPVRIHVEINRR